LRPFDVTSAQPAFIIPGWLLRLSVCRERAIEYMEVQRRGRQFFG